MSFFVSIIYIHDILEYQTVNIDHNILGDIISLLATFIMAWIDKILKFSAQSTYSNAIVILVMYPTRSRFYESSQAMPTYRSYFD